MKTQKTWAVFEDGRVRELGETATREGRSVPRNFPSQWGDFFGMRDDTRPQDVRSEGDRPGSFRSDPPPIQLTNNTSTSSLLYGLTSGHSRTQHGPGGNMYQVYTWKEPLDRHPHLPIPSNTQTEKNESERFYESHY